MSVPTINKIKELRDEIRQARRSIKPLDYEGQDFGPESEYTAQGLLAGLDGLITDVSTLVKAPVRFTKQSSHAERNQLISVLAPLCSSVVNKDLSGLVSQIDLLKPLVTRYQIRHTTDRQEEFDKYIDELQKNATILENQIERLSEIKENGEHKNSKIQEVFEALEEKVAHLDELESKLSQLIEVTSQRRDGVNSMLEVDEERTQRIEELLADAKSHKEVVENFSKRVSERDVQLENQEAKTKRYKKVLTEWETERSALLDKANELIESAKTALEYKTAEGLSAAFATKYAEAKADNSTMYWIIGAGVFVAAAVAIGIWVFYEKEVNIEAVLGRLSIIPVLIAGAWFCSGQYVKQRNIMEDYAYKSVLAKSLVGFSSQLSDSSEKGEDHSHFIKSVLAEIHNDPLRNRSQGRAREDPQAMLFKRTMGESKVIKRIADHLDKVEVQ